ncbi:MAG TPA: arginase family protein [Yinghuangia sp.]|uniref:arginase family protein n=1 Tax=Yinghuangia sp. YIM S10712 TaxID=3436930 RepID=UPI002C3CBAD3|nr:arginase family protein [Yinghuangia sp.]
MAGTDWFLLGAPWDSSGGARGEESAPQALRAAGLADWVGRDVGDAETSIRTSDRDTRTGVRALPDTVMAARRLAGTLAGALHDEPDRRPLVVGGDCSLLLGVFGALPGGTGLWFVDGHADYLDGDSSDSGETADMELAMLHGHGPPDLVRSGLDEPMLRAADTVLIGHRAHPADNQSVAELTRLPDELPRIDADTVRDDPSGSGRRAADRIDTESCWLHIDLDVLDPTSLPAVTYPQPGGPDWEQLTALLRPLAASPRLAGVSVADFRPDLDPDGMLAHRVVGMVTEVLAAP